ncbi:LOW QUALITY PROTEIN: hypothetical protein Cgig2_003181 [Carnegiea gigantea]|uniref:CCHC-type domain-containing protein n=1 Tax=Carnegiea gigantea TaxID=171969 RepID=A0A9Q1K3C5_9CARY|nr:LOW QUALITY PROTEIN: hypothetical protein Cgig2_003181 [Carnegiea gigantea]
MLGRVVRGRSRGKVMLLGGRKDCVWVKENIGVLEVLRLVEEAMGEGIRGRQMWYNLKCNRLELLPSGLDGDVKKLMKGNDDDRERGEATVDAAGDVARVVDRRVVTEQVVRIVVGKHVALGGTLRKEIPEKGRKLMRQLSGRNKLSLKVDKRKTELENWKNGVGDRIKMKLRKTLGNIGSVADVKLFNMTLGEYGVLFTNNRSLVVYDYVSDCYKAATQNMIYMNNIHPMETHDSTTVDNAVGMVVGGEALDDGYNRRILPLINPRPQGISRKRRIESQRQGVQARRCSKCGEVGHYRNTCRNPRADFNADETNVVVPVEDLFEGNYVQEA